MAILAKIAKKSRPTWPFLLPVPCRFFLSWRGDRVRAVYEFAYPILLSSVLNKYVYISYLIYIYGCKIYIFIYNLLYIFYYLISQLLIFFLFFISIPSMLRLFHYRWQNIWIPSCHLTYGTKNWRDKDRAPMMI